MYGFLIKNCFSAKSFITAPTLQELQVFSMHHKLHVHVDFILVTRRTELAASIPALIFSSVNISSSVVQMRSNFYGIGQNTLFEV